VDKVKRLVTLIAFLTIGMMAFASVPTHHRVTVDHTYTLTNTVLAPGTYKVVIEGDRATISNKDQTELSDLQVETAPQKFRRNAFVSRTNGDKTELVAIEVGGTHYKVLVK